MKRIRWISNEQARFFDETIRPRLKEFAVEEIVLNVSPRTIGGFFYLLDVSPVGGWKGKNWLFFWHDYENSDLIWHRTREEADRTWAPFAMEYERQTNEPWEFEKHIVTTARMLVDEKGLDPVLALAGGYASAAQTLSKYLDGRQMAYQLRAATDTLVEHGVLNEKSSQETLDAEIKLLEFITAPERIIALYGVRDLAAWPTE